MSGSFLITHSSLRQLFDRHFEPLCRYLSYYSHNHAVIEEIVQDVFVKLWDERNSLQIESVKTYLYTSARNRMLNHIRNEKRRNILLEQWTENELKKSEGEECFDIDEFSRLVRTAIQALPEKCRNIFELSKTQNLTYKQIADKLNISVKTVETQMGIALRKIRENLSIYYPQINNTLWFLLCRI